MTSLVPGLSGTLMPEQYVAAHVEHDIGQPGGPNGAGPRTTRHLVGWWEAASTRCGPASPMRVIFDDLAMPLFGILGFRAQDAEFDGTLCRARLTTPGGSPVALVITTWAARPSSRWACVADHADRIGAAWGIVLAPPFLSLLPTAGHASRRSLDFALPALFAGGGARHLIVLLHASRFDASPGDTRSVLARAVERADAHRAGVKADLQTGVSTALATLVPAIRDITRGSTARDVAPFDQALTIVYRILFLLFAESRLLLPATDRIYAEAYAIEHLCQQALRGVATGLWDALAAASRLSRLGCQTMDLRVSPFNGALFARAAAPALERHVRRSRGRGTQQSSDSAVATTLVALASRQTRAGTERILFRDLGVEQLGAVYERVLDLPAWSTPPGASARRGSRHSRTRRETGTFYTPQPLADFVVRRTLAPLVDGATTDDIVRLRVLDPAMGSGAFLVAACRYLAAAYEEAAVAEGRCDAEDLDEHERANIRRLIAERCLAGVDRNGTAVQLARLSLWLATLSEGRPLGFLDHRLRTGDSLVGAWPDDLQHVSSRTRAGTRLPLFDIAELDGAAHVAIGPLARILRQRDDTVTDVRSKEEAWRIFQSDTSPLQRWRLASHVWCARWFAGSDNTPTAAETRALMAALLTTERTLPASHVRARIDQAASTARGVGFFHWPLEFPDVFLAGPDGRTHEGFDAIIGNPPWEVLRREPGDSAARSAALLRYVRQSGSFPSCTEGHLNLYQAFVDRTLSLVRHGGRIGLVLPWSLATDDGSRALRRRLFRETRLDLMVGLDNAHGLFPIHRGVRMAVLTATSGGSTDAFNTASGIRDAQELDALPSRGAVGTRNVRLSTRDVDRIGGPAARIPDLRRRDDLHVLTWLAERFPQLGARDGWHVTFGRELNATDIGRELIDDGDAGHVPVIEGKHLGPFVIDTRSVRRLPMSAVVRRLAPERFDHARLGYRDVSGFGNRLTLIAAVIPAHAITTHTVFVVKERLNPHAQQFLCACLNSFVVNAVVRMLMGGHVTTSLAEALSIPVWRGDVVDRTIARLASRLARPGAPPALMPRLQALVAHRFGLAREVFRHVIEGFPLVAAPERAAALAWFERYAGRPGMGATARPDERLSLP